MLHESRLEDGCILVASSPEILTRVKKVMSKELSDTWFSLSFVRLMFLLVMLNPIVM